LLQRSNVETEQTISAINHYRLIALAAASPSTTTISKKKGQQLK
jgi:hypothetical protein